MTQRGAPVLPEHLDPAADAVAAATIPLSRRDMLRRGVGAVLAASVAGGCSAGTLASTGAGVRRVRPLARVHISPDRLIRTTAGLRPYRPSGFVVQAERFDEKTVIHNYGHGGGGISLCWGSSALAAELAGATGEARFAVLGSGALGLTTARLLQDRGHQVTIYAKDLPPFTTSNMSGGQWSPATVSDPGRTTPEYQVQFERAARYSHRYFQTLVGSPYGVRWIENYVLGDRPPGGNRGAGSGISDLFPAWEVFGPGEHPFSWPYAQRFVTMLIEPSIFLTAITQDFLMRGGKIEVREFGSVREVLALPQRAIVNCTGLGARALFGDEELTPIKGQLAVLIPQPEVDYITIGGGLYMFPRSDGIVLGGTHERGVWSLDNDAGAIARIIDGNDAILNGG